MNQFIIPQRQGDEKHKRKKPPDAMARRLGRMQIMGTGRTPQLCAFAAANRLGDNGESKACGGRVDTEGWGTLGLCPNPHKGGAAP